MAYIVGIDPGPTPGIVGLQTENLRLAHVDYMQCSMGLVATVLSSIHNVEHINAMAIERFVLSPRAARSTTPSAGKATRMLVHAVTDWAALRDVTLTQRSAAEVKPWALETRLRKAGLWDITAGIPHARDAARHALFHAVRGGWLPDPLSRDWRKG